MHKLIPILLLVCSMTAMAEQSYIDKIKASCNGDQSCITRVESLNQWLIDRGDDEKLYIPVGGGFVCYDRQAAIDLYNLLTWKTVSWKLISDKGCRNTKSAYILYIRPLNVEDNGVIVEVDYIPAYAEYLEHGYTISSFLQPLPGVVK